VTVAVSIFSRIGREINIRSEEEGRTEGERKRERDFRASQWLLPEGTRD
jgi:hypothetical protein